ncbi:hypothetical protein F2Q69_00030211 [Brassica cretica]|uniref:Uncharacterized protein n=1 Tax=Brassica cretica TaxID=69181 RepID=A0A8S9RVQ9_BRACR|nr:hypothetical protein F2Q69_00030211 [Brassica cretica]
MTSRSLLNLGVPNKIARSKGVPLGSHMTSGSRYVLRIQRRISGFPHDLQVQNDLRVINGLRARNEGPWILLRGIHIDKNLPKEGGM